MSDHQIEAARRAYHAVRVQRAQTLLNVSAWEPEAFAAALAAADAWRPISEAPKDGTRRLLFMPDSPVCIGNWSEENANWCMDMGGWLGQVVPTHWRPLPAPPKFEP